MTTTIYEGPEAVERLAELGLTQDILHDAIDAGELARSTATRHDPPTAPGYFGWAAIVRSLRDQLVTDDWFASEDMHLSTVVSPDGAHAIAATLGDQRTGDADQDPTTKNPRGSATIAAVELNQGQLELPGFETDVKHRKTYLLLTHRTSKEILSELSLPDSIGADNRVETWGERIILDPIPLVVTPPMPVEPTAPIEIEIARKRPKKSG